MGHEIKQCSADDEVNLLYMNSMGILSILSSKPNIVSHKTQDKEPVLYFNSLSLLYLPQKETIKLA